MYQTTLSPTYCGYIPIMMFRFSRTHSWLHRLEFIEVFYKVTAYLPYFLIFINTLINTIKSEKIECMGYFYQNCLRPKHLFQFADDTAIVTALESDNQHLCNVFFKWTSWADLTIKVSKCHTFSIRQNTTASEQFQPYITIRKQRIPPVEQDKSFTYL